MYKLSSKEAEEPEIKLPTFFLIMGETKESQKNIYFCFINYTKAFDHAQQEMGVPDYLTCLLRNLYVGQEATVRTGHGTTSSKLGKEYNKGVCCHPAYLIYMQSISCEMPGWINHKLESRLLGGITTTSDIQMILL